MASTTQRKRPVDEPARPRGARPAKKQRRQRAYHSSSSSSDSEDDHGAAAPPDRLFGSDDGNGDLEHAEVDDGASSVSHSPAPAPAPPASACDAGARRPAKAATSQAPRKASKSLADDSDDDADGSGEAGAEGIRSGPAARSKRNDAAAFATSIAKLLTTSKLTTRQRADPIVARSAGSRVAAQRAVDAALEARARRRLRQEKRAKAEKGRVRDVVVGVAAGEVEERGEAGGGVGERERRLRKVAQRGVVKLFNAVRAAQVKASEAERQVNGERVVGTGRKQEKITEMSKKGFLDLIASGGGGLKKGGL